ncbi:MAG: hypothetical protein V7646_4557 [Pseudonocardia sp.]
MRGVDGPRRNRRNGRSGCRSRAGRRCRDRRCGFRSWAGRWFGCRDRGCGFRSGGRRRRYRRRLRVRPWHGRLGRHRWLGRGGHTGGGIHSPGLPVPVAKDSFARRCRLGLRSSGRSVPAAARRRSRRARGARRSDLPTSADYGQPGLTGGGRVAEHGHDCGGRPLGVGACQEATLEYFDPDELAYQDSHPAAAASAPCCAALCRGYGSRFQLTDDQQYPLSQPTRPAARTASPGYVANELASARRVLRELPPT